MRRPGWLMPILLFALAAGCSPSAAPPAPPVADEAKPSPPPAIGAIDLSTGQAPSIALTPPPQGEGTPTDLVDVQFVTERDGFGVSFHGSIYQSRDGGITWREVARREGIRFRTIDFLDAAHGWALGVAECPKDDADCSGPLVLVTTADGGKTWTNADTAAFPAPGSTAWRSLEVKFVTPQAGFALAPASTPDPSLLLATTDGGKSWQPVRLPAGVRLVGGSQVLTPAHGFVTGVKGQEYQLLETRDAGRTWQVRFATREYALGAVQFLDEQHGFLGGGNGDQHYKVGTQNPHRVLLATQDGGASWQEIHRTDERQAGKFKQLHFETPLRGWASDGPSFDSGGLLRTTDGGKTWTRQLAPRVVTRFSAVGDRVWVAWASFLYHTADAGASWHTLFQPAAVVPHQVQFLDARTGWLNTNVGLFRTTDGGKSWAAQPVGAPVDPWDLRAWPYFASPDIAFGYKENRLVRSADSGQTWTQVALEPRLTNPPAVSFIDPKRGFMSVPDGTVGPASPYPDFFMTTADGGATWTKLSQRLPTDSHLDFANAVHGVAAGGMFKEAKLMLTADGGQTWSTTTIPSFFFRSVNQVDARHIWIAGTHTDQDPDQGVLLHSADGGATWTVYSAPSFTEFDPMQVQFVSPTEGWLVANVKQRPVLAHTDDGGKTWRQVWPSLPGRP